MALSDSVHGLSELLADVEQGPCQVRRVSTGADGCSLVEDGCLSVVLELEQRSVESGAIELPVSGVELTDDGTAELAVSAPAPFDPAAVGPTTSIECDRIRLEDDAVVFTYEIAVPIAGVAQRTDADVAIEKAPPEPDTGAGTPPEEETEAEPTRRSRDVPAFEDAAYLREIYESHDTFAEMRDALDLDVTAETVRRYMIDCDVHEPTSYDTGRDDRSDVEQTTGSADPELAGTADPQPAHSEEAADSAADPVLVTDGIGLPEDVPIERLIDAIEESNTLYDVQRRVGTDREQVRTLLERYNLLDLVMGRLSQDPGSEVTREDVIERLRSCSSG